ncbi:hypothetical protein NDU88_005444 [Pleurodeles waltl]|uniref:Uncharacterized protein n=1 Tax=Pleurodeles waltl TaxID=8319 RepID=A0AAV7WXW4_PLEWA|nr:hypothetical protein NDU88_005444 [Pleurodeles waltl]
MPRPAIPLWRLHPDLLGDPEYKKDLQDVLVGSFHTNWDTAGTRGLEWEALKVVIRGVSLSKTYGIRQRLDRELTHQEEVLATPQRQVDNGDASEADCLECRPAPICGGSAVLIPEGVRLLGMEITCEELIAALVQLQTDKAPGPEGFPAEFWRLTWPQGGRLLQHMFNKAMTRSDLPRDHSAANIVVILKLGLLVTR